MKCYFVSYKKFLTMKIKSKIKVIILHTITFTLGVLAAFYVIIGLEPCPYLGVTNRAVNYTDYYRDIDIHVIPSDRFRVTFLVEYPLPALGTQYEAIYNMEEDFAVEVAPARTFCFLSEIEMLKEQGLIKGGGLDNALVIVDKKIDQIEINRIRHLLGIEEEVIQGANGILNGKLLRFKNEPVRHKTLDLIGDLALLGTPIKGHVTAARAGHASNVEFVKKLKKENE